MEKEKDIELSSTEVITAKDKNLRLERCKGCEHAFIRDFDGLNLFTCCSILSQPYGGLWVAEIENCPIGKKVKIKYFYAMSGHDGGKTCFKFKSKEERAEAMEHSELIPLTAAEAMKRFGYTDSASRRVIKAEEW